MAVRFETPDGGLLPSLPIASTLCNAERDLLEGEHDARILCGQELWPTSQTWPCFLVAIDEGAQAVWRYKAMLRRPQVVIAVQRKCCQEVLAFVEIIVLRPSCSSHRLRWSAGRHDGLPQQMCLHFNSS